MSPCLPMLKKKRIAIAIVISIALMLLDPKESRAQAHSIQDDLNSMTVVAISNKYSNGELTKEIVGHVAIRCSIISSTMSEVLKITIPLDADADIRDNALRMSRQYADRSTSQILDASKILGMQEEDFLSLYHKEYDTWSEALVESAVQLFKKHEPKTKEAAVADAFRDELMVCNLMK